MTSVCQRQPQCPRAADDCYKKVYQVSLPSRTISMFKLGHHNPILEALSAPAQTAR